MSAFLDALQEVLSFGNCTSKNFGGNGMGKIGTTGFILGAVGGVHLGVYVTISLLSPASVDLSNSPFVPAVVRTYLVRAAISNPH
jgi:hypothetical protein